MKKSKIMVLSLLAVSALGLTSCGSQGIQGEKGEPGIQGKQGEPGKDGKDGVNGKDGKDGAPGKDGKNGINGADGKTAWSNTILPSVGGYVVPSVGSAIEGADVTFTVHVENDYTLTALFLNGENHSVEQKTDKTYETTAKMVKNGFVVSATFIKTADIATTPVADQNTGKAYKDVSDAIEGGASTIRLLNDAKLEATDSSSTTEINIVNDLTIDLNQHKLESKRTLNVDVGKTLRVKNGDLNVGNFTASDKGKLAVDKDATLELENVDFVAPEGLFPCGDASKVSVIGGSVKGYGYGLATNARGDLSNNVVLELKDTTVSVQREDCCAVWLNVAGSLSIENSTIEGGDQGLFVRAGNAVVKNSTIKARLKASADGNYDGANPNSGYSTCDGPEFMLNSKWGQGNMVLNGAVVVGDYKNDTYKSDASLTLENVKVETTNTKWNRGLIVLSSDIDASTKLNFDDKLTINGTNVTEANATTTYGSKNLQKTIYVHDVDVNGVTKGDIYINDNLVRQKSGEGNLIYDINTAATSENKTIVLKEDATTYLSTLYLNEKNKGVTIDLNNKVLKGAIEVVEGSDVIIKNGNFDGQLTTVENAKATFENVKFDKDNANKLFEPSRKASDTDNKLDLTFKNCEFVGPNFGFSTNAKWKSTNSYGKITFEGCTFTPKDPLNGGDATGLMINVPVNVEINNCIFNGSRQCLIVRCGTVEVKDSTFNYDKAYDGNDAGHFLSGSWRDGNRVATAMITVGSLNGSYPADATLKLTGTNTFNGEYDENHKSIVIACGTNSATVEMTSEIAESLKANAMTMKPESGSKTITIKIGGTAATDWLNN